MERFPFVIINQQVFADALTNGYWATQPIQQSSITLVGQNLSLFTFPPTRTGTAESKHQLDETNAIFGEELVGTVNSHHTKATLKPYDSGNIQHYSHLLYMISNLLLVVEAADGPNQPYEPMLVTHLKEFLKVPTHKEVKEWVETFTKTPKGKYLLSALALDMQNNSWLWICRTTA
jgi:hypothetical protein